MDDVTAGGWGHPPLRASVSSRIPTVGAGVLTGPLYLAGPWGPGVTKKPPASSQETKCIPLCGTTLGCLPLAGKTALRLQQQADALTGITRPSLLFSAGRSKVIFLPRVPPPCTTRRLSARPTKEYSSFSSPKRFNYRNIISYFIRLSMDSGRKKFFRP